MRVIKWGWEGDTAEEQVERKNADDEDVSEGEGREQKQQQQ